MPTTIPEIKPNHTIRTASELYGLIEEQYEQVCRQQLLNGTENNRKQNPKLSPETALRAYVTGNMLAALEVATERITRGDYDDNAIDAVTEIFCLLMGTEFHSTRDMLTLIRDSLPKRIEDDTNTSENTEN